MPVLKTGLCDRHSNKGSLLPVLRRHPSIPDLGESRRRGFRAPISLRKNSPHWMAEVLM
jgi:hypothetical protein